MRWKFPDPAAPCEEIRAIQACLRLHPKLGFTWQENTPHEKNIVFAWADNILDPLCTDEQGFKNHPAAIHAHRQGLPIDIVGIGDSFFQGAAYTFHESFQNHGVSYYSLGMHRYCPPQYNIVLGEYALAMGPKFILYGVFENDFLESEDFQNWRASGLDWFTFHSGTWCGPSLEKNPKNFMTRCVQKNLPGWSRWWRKIYRWSNTQRQDPSIILPYIRNAYQQAKDQNIRFLLILIPSKETAMAKSAVTDHPYDRIKSHLRQIGVPFIDLRDIFQRTEDPSTLYYRLDGHWNRTGMKKAATVVWDQIKQNQNLPS